MDTNQSAPPSGLPYLAYLSGLNLGQGGMSGAMDPSLSGGGAQQPSGPGATGGLSLSELQQLLMQQQGDTSIAAPGVTGGQILQGIGGTVGQGTLAGGGAVAGNPTAGGGGGYTAGQSSGGGIDPMAIIKQALGLGAKAVGAFGGTSGSPSGPQTGYTAGQTGGGGTGQISPSGYSLTGAGAPEAGSPEGLSQYFGGQFTGTNLFQDPTFGPLMTRGLLEGSLTPSDIANFSSLGGDQLAGLRTALASGDIQSDFGGQLLSGQGGGQGYSLGGNTNLDLSGGGATGGYGLGNVASGLGGLQGILGLVQGAQSGSPTSILQGLQSAYGGITGALGISPIADLIAQYAPQLGSALVSAAGTGASAGAATGASALAPAISAALSGLGAAAAPIIAAITSYIGNQEEMNARNAGYVNNPIKGGLYSAATQGVGRDLGLLDQIQQQGGLGNVGTQQLEQVLPGLLNNLMPYYATAQGGLGPIRASDTLTGGHGLVGGTSAPGLGGADEYTAKFGQAQQGLYDVINTLMGRGVSYEQLGQLPGFSPDWSQRTLDVYNPLQDLYAGRKSEYDTQAQNLMQRFTASNRQLLDPQEAEHMASQGLNPATFGYTQDASGNWYSPPQVDTATGFIRAQPGQLTPDLLFQAAQGSAPYAADRYTHAGGLMSSMYGGPLWEAMARMGGQSSPYWNQIQQHFNPWAVLGGFSGGDIGTSLQPILQAQLMGGDPNLAGSSGPGIAGPGGPGNGPGGE
jgi:hypothetical protein